MNPTFPTSPRQLRRSAFLAIASIFAISGLLIGALVTGTLDFSPESIAAVPKAPQELPGSQVHGLDKGFAHIVKSVRPAIVNITAFASSVPTQGQ